MLINFLSLLKGYKQENAWGHSQYIFLCYKPCTFFFSTEMFSTVILMSFLWSTCSIKERPTFPTSTPTVSCCYSNSEKHRSKSWLEARALSAMSMTFSNLDRPTTQLIFVYVCPYWSRNQNPRLSTLETLKRTTRHSSSRVERLWSRELLGPINLSRVMTRYLVIYMILQTLTGDEASPNLSPEAKLLNHVTQLLRDGAFQFLYLLSFPL